MNTPAEIAALKQRIAELEAKINPKPAEPKPGDLPPHLHRDHANLVRDEAGRQVFFVDGEWLNSEQLMAKGKKADEPRIGGLDLRAEEAAADARAREGLPTGYFRDPYGFVRDPNGHRCYFVNGYWSKTPPVSESDDARLTEILEEQRRDHHEKVTSQNPYRKANDQ